MIIGHDQWKWYGYDGHFIGGRRCAYHLSTRIGNFLVSTVGDYRPRGEPDQMQSLGAGDEAFFETMVFDCAGEDEHGDPIIKVWSSLDGERYPVSIEAERGHYVYCEKYARRAAS